MQYAPTAVLLGVSNCLTYSLVFGSPLHRDAKQIYPFSCSGQKIFYPYIILC
ncbi:MAG: hypothetical protein Q4D72_07765 [Capnocytophaga sp.]|nr:hypothetical protein [Capnocytophaga sp.]